MLTEGIVTMGPFFRDMGNAKRSNMGLYGTFNHSAIGWSQDGLGQNLLK